jgi:hypothetical protein
MRIDESHDPGEPRDAVGNLLPETCLPLLTAPPLRQQADVLFERR